ncbi:MAG: hypothetical protein ACR2NH_09160 [Solirubrobacteraceae bacterium]
MNPDTELARVAAQEGWEVMRFESLGRRLKVAGALVVATAVGGLGRELVARRARPQPRVRRPAIPARR